MESLNVSNQVESALDEVRRRLTGGLQIFLGPVDELTARFGRRYLDDADRILDCLGVFAQRQRQTLADVLELYGRYILEVIEQRRQFLETGSYETELAGREPGTEGLTLGVGYLYILTLSTVLNRSRYEVFRHFRQVVPGVLPMGSSILEIGGGNCLDALFTSSYGRVISYELNRASMEWHELLDLTGRVDLRIEPYTFGDEACFDFVSMVELLEHLRNPAEYLRGAYRVLRDGGHGYFTFAVRMPQVDHLYQFHSIDECRTMLEEEGFSLLEEFCAVDTLYRFSEAERWHLAEDPRHALIYACMVRKSTTGGPLEDFLDDLEAE